MQRTHHLAWTEEQQQTQADLQRRLQEQRQAPAEGRPVPDQARRDGTLNN